MNKRIKKINLVAVFSVLIMFGVITTNSWAANLSIVPDSQNVLLGDSFDVGIQISGLGVGVAPSLGAYDLDIAFDSAILDFVGIEFGDSTLGNQLDLFGFGTFNNVQEPGAGMVNIFELSFDLPGVLDNLQMDEFILAVLSFDTLALGTSLFDLSVNALGDAGGTSLPVDIEFGSVSVTSQASIPEPNTVLLLMLGLFVINFGTKRKFMDKEYHVSLL